MEQYAWEVSTDGYVFSHINDIRDDIQRYMLRNELDRLFMEDLAEYQDECYRISHEVASTFSKKERNLLQLPDVFPYYMTLKSQSDMGHPDFRYALTFATPKGEDFLHPTIIGSYIAFHDELKFMFSEMQYKIITMVQACNEKIQEIHSRELAVFNYEHFAEIKKYAEQVKMTMDSYLTHIDVIVPEKLTISVEKNDDDSYAIKPVFLVEKNNRYTEVSDHTLYNNINKRDRIKSSYVGENNKKYIIKKDIQEGIQQVKKYKRTNQELTEQIIQAPQEVFNSEAFSFDISYYADRVEGIGEYLRKNLPYVKMTSGSWLPEEGSTHVSEPALPPLPTCPEQANELLNKIDKAQQNNEKYITINGSQYKITPDLIEALRNLKERPTSEETTPEITLDTPEKSGATVLQIADNFDDVRYTAEKRRKQSISNPLEQMDLQALNPDITLYEHQKEGLRWIKQCWTKGYKGVLLADDMGLGKTVQAYSFIASLRCCYAGNIPSVLIVAPVSLLQNWHEEYKKFLKSNLFETIIELYGPKAHFFRGADGLLEISQLAYNKIILTTYETLRRYQLSLGKITWSVMIIDEAQKIKNPTTMISLAIKAMNYEFGIALTGTPVENTWVDLWSIMDFVSPGKLRSLREFYQAYQRPIEKIKDDAEALSLLGGKLKNDLKPLFLRRLKKDYLDGLPKKEIIKLEEPMPEIQYREYEQIIQYTLQEKRYNNKNSILQTIAKLRDISLCPNLNIFTDAALLASNGNDIIQSSARLQVTFQVLDEIKGRNEKVLIFVTSRKMQNILKFIIEKKYNIYVFGPINGEILSSRRQETVNRFNKFKGFSVLLLSAEAGGVGFNITSANNVIHLSRCWNPAKEDQATDRVYRIGQKNTVHVYIPIAYDPNYPKDISFDERLDQLLDHKRGLSESVLYPTGDSEQDGFTMFNDIVGSMQKEEKNGTSCTPTPYFTIDDMNLLDGEYFERVICFLYNKIPGYSAEKTKSSYDNGADIIVLSETAEKPNLLIQCKQTSARENIGGQGVAEVKSAMAYYEQMYKKKFTGIVITNAPGFTYWAKKKAKYNDIKLLCYHDLRQLLQQYPVSKLSI